MIVVFVLGEPKDGRPLQSRLKGSVERGDVGLIGGRVLPCVPRVVTGTVSRTRPVKEPVRRRLATPIVVRDQPITGDLSLVGPRGPPRYSIRTICDLLFVQSSRVRDFDRRWVSTPEKEWDGDEWKHQVHVKQPQSP